MLRKARRRVAQRLPEPLLHTLVRTRYGEMPWQQRVRRASVGPPLADGYLTGTVNRHGLRAQLADHFDAHVLRADLVATVSRALDDEGIPHVGVPGNRGRPTRLGVSVEHRGATLAALAAHLRGPHWAVEALGAPPSVRGPSSHAVRADSLHAQQLTTASGLRIYPVLGSASGHLLDTAAVGCELDFWRRIDSDTVPRPDGGMFLPGTRLAPTPSVVAYLAPSTWQAATESPAHWPPSAILPSLFDVQAPVDLVYTWVDGADPSWLQRKLEHTDAADRNRTADHDSRYVSRDELRYSLRSVAAYASWVNRIYIVTDAQVPAWLDVSHPKIRVVDHTEIFGDPSVLPVFNSHAIESQLHHIDGLSEQYLYVNDDVFFARPVLPELFFHGNGLGKFFLSPATLDIDVPSHLDLPVMSAAKRNRQLIEERFEATITNKFKHTPHPQLRSVLVEMEQRHPEVFADVARSRFRHHDDVSITSALHHYYAYGLGRAVPGEIVYVYQDIARVDAHRRLGNLLRTRHADVFCLNDTESSPDRIEAQRLIMADFFERYFPVPSPFELSAPRP